VDIKLERAIEIMEAEEEDTFVGGAEEWKAAVKVSYEAMKDIKSARAVGFLPKEHCLPGETPE